MAVLDSLVVFVVSLVVGALGVHVGALLVTGVNDYSRAVWTALFGAIVWTLAGWLVGGIPGLGPLLVLLAYVWVIKWRYPGSWLTAGAVALVAWVAALLLLSLLADAGYTAFRAVGVPGL